MITRLHSHVYNVPEMVPGRADGCQCFDMVPKHLPNNDSHVEKAFLKPITIYPLSSMIIGKKLCHTSEWY